MRFNRSCVGSRYRGSGARETYDLTNGCDGRKGQAMSRTDWNDTRWLRVDGTAPRKRRSDRATVLPTGGAIPGMARVMRNVERRAASRRICI